mgnify:CR=1 FL=1
MDYEMRVSNRYRSLNSSNYPHSSTCQQGLHPLTFLRECGPTFTLPRFMKPRSQKRPICTLVRRRNVLEFLYRVAQCNTAKTRPTHDEDKTKTTTVTNRYMYCPLGRARADDPFHIHQCNAPKGVYRRTIRHNRAADRSTSGLPRAN